MYTIDQEALCNYCEENYSSSRDHCEGSRCEAATSDYMHDHGLIESIEGNGKDSGRLKFEAIGVDDIIYALDREKLTFKEVRIFGVSRGNDPSTQGYRTFQQHSGYLVKVYHNHTEHRSKESSMAYFTEKKAMKACYKEIMISETLRMAETLAKI